MSPGPSKVPVWVELSGENLPLAERELEACASVLDPSASSPRPLPWGGDRFREVTFSRPGPEGLLAHRLSFAHRVLRPVAEGTLDTMVDSLVLEGGRGDSARVRVAPGTPAPLGPRAPEVLGHAFVQGGGRIDLDAPDRDLLALFPRQLAEPVSSTEGGLGEVVGEVPREEVEGRRAKHRPFRRPVTLPPRLARALVNLARGPLGGSLLDPLCGTGAILLEAALLGYRVSGADRDTEMVRGTLENLRAVGVTPERMVQCEVQRLPEVLEGFRFDSVVFDPPYGRASSTGGRTSEEVLHQTLDALPSLLEKRGRAVLLLHDPALLVRPPEGFEVETSLLGQRVHRSLTRWIVVLRRQS